MLLYDGEAQIVHPTRTMTIVYPYSFANRARHIVAIITTSMSLIATTVAAELPSTVIAALKAASIPARNVSVAVLDVDSGRPLIRHNAQQAMNPYRRTVGQHDGKRRRRRAPGLAQTRRVEHVPPQIVHG